MRSVPSIPVCALDYPSECAVSWADRAHIAMRDPPSFLHRVDCETTEVKSCEPVLDRVLVSGRESVGWYKSQCKASRYKAMLFLSLWATCGERHGQKWRKRGGIFSSRLTCLCSDPVLQCAAVQMMSSPPAACCSKCDARPLQREDGGRDEWEGKGRRQGRWATKQHCNNTVTL